MTSSDGDDDDDLAWMGSSQSVASHLHFSLSATASCLPSIGLLPYLASLTNRYPHVIVIVQSLCNVLSSPRAGEEPGREIVKPILCFYNLYSDRPKQLR